jgi:hypothetical protein
MKFLCFFLTIQLLTYSNSQSQQLPCSDSVFRSLDFWVGEWDVYDKKGDKAGDSKVTVILDSCVILEEWSTLKPQKNFYYKGKSFNLYNGASHQWQETWVDNTGGATEYLRGTASAGKVVFFADHVMGGKKEFMRRLSFIRINSNEVRQFAERSDDTGATWTVEYDLKYLRKK